MCGLDRGSPTSSARAVGEVVCAAPARSSTVQYTHRHQAASVALHEHDRLIFYGEGPATSAALWSSAGHGPPGPGRKGNGCSQGRSLLHISSSVGVNIGGPGTTRSISSCHGTKCRVAPAHRLKRRPTTWHENVLPCRPDPNSPRARKPKKAH